VVTRGAYRWVRHPGYAGTIAAPMGPPLLLASLWALIPASLLAALFVLRMRLEDRTLTEELPAYDAYPRPTRFRLLPGIW
jgi:protein-S-isoprenylcysteine O-methyltransferase Ste14